MRLSLHVLDNHRQPIWRTAVCLALALAAATSCTNERLPALALNGATMGTQFNILLVDAPDTLNLEELRFAIQRELDGIENIASTYRHDAELSRLNSDHSSAPTSISPELCNMLSAAWAVSRQTDGAFDITIGHLVNLWGFGPDFDSALPPESSSITTSLQNSGYKHLSIDCDQNTVTRHRPAMQIDLSGWAKGFAVDRLVDVIATHGIDNFLVEIGGEISARGYNTSEKLFAVGLENPVFDEIGEVPVVYLCNESVATSGDYRNFVEVNGQRYSHLLDPRTGHPAGQSIAAATVIHGSTSYADALATAIMVLGPDAGMTLANHLEIAAFLSVRTESGIEYRPSAAFILHGYLEENRKSLCYHHLKNETNN